MKDEGYLALDEKNDFVLVHSFEQARIKDLEYFNPMTLVKVYVRHELNKSSFSYMELVLRLTHSTHYGRWTEAMTRLIQRARQSTSRGRRKRCGTERDVFEWRMLEHIPQGCITQSMWGALVTECAFPAGIWRCS